MCGGGTSYQHEPLNGTRSIRLLSLAEGFSPICPHMDGCNSRNWKFVHASLDDPPPYLAISYVWGSSARRHHFLGRDGCLDVTESATKVLNYLIMHYQTPINIWIDALCIDQDNLDEKRIQLRLMRDVYKNAMQVIAWLGEYDSLRLHTGLSNTSAWGLRSLFEEVHASAKHRNADFDPDEVIDPGCQHVLDKGEDVLGAISLAIDSPWFHRIWVFQEVVFGSCVLMVATCEDRSLELLWDDLATYLRNNNLIHIGEKIGFDRRTYGYANCCIMAGRRAIMKATPNGNQSQASLGTLLTEVSPYHEATDPRDLMYALIALSSDFTFDDLQPAYQDEVESVFIEVTSLVLQLQRVYVTQPLALLFLAGTGCHRSLHSLPTWVPDWTSAAQYLRFIGASLHRLSMSRLEIISERAGFDATRGSPMQAPYVTHGVGRGPVLTVRGLIIDTVRKVGQKYPRALFQHEQPYTRPEPELAHDCSIWIQENNDLAVSVSPYCTGESSEELLWRTLIADTRQDSRPWDVIIGTTCLPTKDQHLYFFQAISGREEWENEVDSSFWADGTSSALRDIAIKRAQRRMRERYSNYRNAFQRHGAGRIVFTTTNGFLGLGPPEMRAGDEVCLVIGTHVPFLPRSLGSDMSHSASKRSLVGECYIRGLMHGFGMELGRQQDINLV